MKAKGDEQITIDLICECVTLRSVVLTQKHVNIILARDYHGI